MKYFLLIAFSALMACNAKSYEKDARQITAKNQLRSLTERLKDFDITSFREDTVPSSIDTNYITLLQYQLDYSYTDSVGKKINKKGVVYFSPDGNAVIKTQILP